MPSQKIKGVIWGAVFLALVFHQFWCARAHAGGEVLDLGTSSTAYGVSADGSVVVGSVNGHAFRWTQAGGMVDLGTLSGRNRAVAESVSADGSVVVGYSYNYAYTGDPDFDFSGFRAFRWTQAGGMVDLGSSGGLESRAYAVSADGSVVVGLVYYQLPWFNALHHAFSWTEAGGMVDLGTFGGSSSVAFGVSADGSVVVGTARDSSGAYHAFRWTQADGMVDLGTLGGTGRPSTAYAVSADGSVVVGRADNQAFRWAQAGGMVGLGTFDGLESMAYAVSADGSVVVGQVFYIVPGMGYYEAFRWTETVGKQTIEQWLGMPASAVRFTESTSVSADGGVVVGYLANYHAFIARKTLYPSPAILVSPSGTIGTNAPIYTWNAVPDADWYCLWVNDTTGNRIRQWYSAAEAGCASGAGNCAVWVDAALASGSGKWWVQTWNAYGYGPWSDPLDFTVAPANLPGKATLLSPSGTIGTIRPTYSWQAVSNANWYWLWVYDGTEYRIKQWYRASQAGCPGGTGTCSVTPEIPLVEGSGKWWIQAYNESGFGPWSESVAFAPTMPVKAALIAPSGTISTNLPTYTWNAVPNSTWYYLWVYDGTEYRITQWYTASQTGCPGGTGICSVTPDVLVGGAAKWWIQTWNSVGYGPWSDAMTFTAPAPTLPGKAVLVSPSGDITTNTPSYTWDAVSNSTWYYLWVYDGTEYRITQWYTASQTGCPGGTGICSVTPDVLVGGSAKWWIQTWNSVGYGPWSDGLEYSVSMPMGFSQ